MKKILILMVLAASSWAVADDAKMIVDCRKAGDHGNALLLQVFQDASGDFRYSATNCLTRRVGCTMETYCDESSGPAGGTGSFNFSNGAVQIRRECGQMYAFDDPIKNLQMSFFDSECKFID